MILRVNASPRIIIAKIAPKTASKLSIIEAVVGLAYFWHRI